MGSVDPIFVFKQHFKRDDADALVASTIHHKLVWDRLKDDSFLQDLIASISLKKEYWTAAHICLLASGCDSQSLSDPALIPNSLAESAAERIQKANSSLEQIPGRAAAILAEKQKYGDWTSYFASQDDPDFSPEAIREEIGTLFSLVYFLAEDRQGLILSLAKADLDGAQDLAAFLLSANPVLLTGDFVDIHEWMTRVPTGKFIQIIDGMSAYDDQATIQSLVDHYIVCNPIKNETVESHNGDHSTDVLLSKISQFRNYAVLARFGSDKNLPEEYSRRATELGSQLNRSLAALKENLNAVLATPQDSTTFNLSEQYAAIEKSAGDSPARKLLHAAEIVESDKATAWKIARSVQQEIRTVNSLQQIIPMNEMGLLIRSEQIVQLFIDMDLIVEAAEIAEKLIGFQPRNNALLRLTAKLFYKYGDYQKAIAYYERLDLSGVLTREEKVNLADAYEHQANWQTALEIWEKTNLVSLEDYQRKVISAYRAGNRTAFEETIKAAESFYKIEGLFRILKAMFDYKEGLHDIAQIEIDGIIERGKRDRWVIQFMIEYFLETSQLEKAAAWIDRLSSIEKEIPEVCLARFEVRKRLADTEACKAILAYNAQHDNHQSLPVIEQLVAWSYEFDDLDDAQLLLARFAYRWPLAPSLINFKARLQIEHGQFKVARETLRPLFNRNEIEESWMVSYGLSLIEKSHAVFPLTDSISTKENKLPVHIEDEALFNQFPESLLLKVIWAELDQDACLEHYQEILSTKHFHQHVDIWRVHAGMGKYYYQNKKYDLALVSFKEARKYQPQNKIISLYLINCFAKMKLFDDAVDVFSSSRIEHQMDIFDFLEINDSLKNSEQWLDVLKVMAEDQPQQAVARIVMAHLYAETGKTDQVLETIQSIDFTGEGEAVKRLVAAQILVDAGYEKAGLKMLEFFLTSNEQVSEPEYLAGAFLYIQMQEYHKAANLLNLIKKSDYAVSALKADLFEKQGLAKEAQAAIQSAMELFEHLDKNETVTGIGWIKQPEIWATVRKDPVWLNIKAIEINLSNHQFETALNEAQHCIQRFPDDMRLASLALNIINVFGNGEFPQDLLERLPENLDSSTVSEGICVYGEIALRNDHEIMAANLVSQCMEILPASLRVKALQARLLVRNGNQQDAHSIFNEILGETMQPKKDSIDALGQYPLWMAEAAFELAAYAESMEICRHIIEKTGILKAPAKLFLNSLVKLAYENWINNKLHVTSHAEEISEENLKAFSAICKAADKNLLDNEITGLVNQANIWLQNQSEIADQSMQMNVDGLQSKELLVSEYYRKGSSAFELNSEEHKDKQSEFVMSLLEMDANPQKAFEYLSDVIRNNGSQPRYYAALAYIKNNLGQHEDAYAAINLALAEWADEYKWQILAGELSKKVGDLHVSLEHFKQAAEIHQDENTQTYLGELNLQAGNRMGISYLESKLTGGEDDLETLIELGELGIKNANYQKATKYLEKARRIDSGDARPYVLLSQVALQVGNMAKAEEMIDQAYRLDAANPAVITQKANIMEVKDGGKQALEFLAQVDHQPTGGNLEIVLKRADIIAAEQGNQTALNYLSSIKENYPGATVLIKIARLYLNDGALDKAEEIAEQALQMEAQNAQVMGLLAAIFAKNGDLDKAIDFYVKALQIDPFAAEFYIALARIYQSRRELARAAEMLKGGLESNPLNFDLLSALGLLYYQQGMYNKSQKYLQQAAKIDPKNENVKRLLSTLMNANIIQASKRKS